MYHDGVQMGWFYYTFSKTRLTENVFSLSPALTLMQNNVFKLTSFFKKVYKYRPNA